MISSCAAATISCQQKKRSALNEVDGACWANGRGTPRKHGSSSLQSGTQNSTISSSAPSSTAPSALIAPPIGEQLGRGEQCVTRSVATKVLLSSVVGEGSDVEWRGLVCTSHDQSVNRMGA